MFLLVSGNCPAQSSGLMAKNIVYLDFGLLLTSGFGTIGFGINYERMLSDNISIRAGVNIGKLAAGVSGDAVGSSGIGFPVSVNYLTNNKNKFEIGLGGGPRIPFDNLNNTGITFIPAARLGYRYQTYEKGMIYRLGFDLPSNMYLSLGSVGYHF